MNFADYMSFEQFKKLYLGLNADDKNDDWKKTNILMEENFFTPLKNFLTAYRDTTGLSKIKHSEGHVSFFTESWNNFVDKKEKIEWRGLEDTFNRLIFDFTSNYEKFAMTDELIKTAYDKSINIINAGNFYYYQLGNDPHKCFECAQRMLLAFKNWYPMYIVYEENPDGSLNYRKYVPPKSCLSKDVIELSVNFPTGELLIADWFRIDEFSQTVEYEGPDKWSDSRSINNAKGRITATTEYAEKFNFISINVGNSSPRIYQDNDVLILGRVNEDDEYEYDEETGKFTQKANFLQGYTEKGSVCTDYWGATVIDKQQLIDIVAIKAGDKATKIVEDYIKENIDNIIHVSPGDYKFKFHGNYWEFNSHLKDDELPKEIKKFLVVSKSELTLENKRKNKM